jgi:hypothetical protein
LQEIIDRVSDIIDRCQTLSTGSRHFRQVCQHSPIHCLARPDWMPVCFSDAQGAMPFALAVALTMAMVPGIPIATGKRKACR